MQFLRERNPMKHTFNSDTRPPLPPPGAATR